MDGMSVIVYYSWVGNTEVVAKEIQRLSGFDLQKIEETKKRKLGSIAGGAIGAFFGLKCNIEPMDFAFASYDNIFLGMPIWAGKTTPAVNRYLSKASFRDKKVWLFITKSDEKEPEKFIASTTKRIAKRGGTVIDVISITTTWDPNTNITISPADVEKRIGSWLTNILVET